MRTKIVVTGLSLLLAASLGAQEQKPLTSVAMIKVKIDKTDAWLQAMKKLYEPTLAGLIKDGTVLGYGIDFDMLHHPGQSNAVAWFDVPNYAAFGKASRAIDEVSGKNPMEMQRMLEMQDMDAHQDLLLETIDSNFKPGSTSKNPYSVISYFKVREGADEDFMSGFNKFIKPGWDKLVADGAINGYSVMREALHGGDMAGRYFLTSMNELSGLDKIRASEEAAAKKLSPDERKGMSEGLRKVSDVSAHRDWLVQSAVFVMK